MCNLCAGDILRHEPTAPQEGASSFWIRHQKDHDPNHFNRRMLFPDIFSEELGISKKTLVSETCQVNRARRHFSQLSEFERGLIIGMKTAGWSTRRVAGQVHRSECAVEIVGGSGHEKVPTHLAEANLKSKRPFRALPLTPEHRQLRLQWCQARSKCNVPDWQKVVFSDESRLVLGTDDNRPFLNGLPGAIFQQDNSRPNTAKVAQDFLRHFQFLPWPALSPDLSPLEHVWDQLKRQMPSCHSVHDLELAVQDLWAHLPQGNIRCLINSMPDRVVACIAAGGGPTRY
ncbi:transposable element Tc1 transposase [Trichonephila clavipes]|nr:transposable element Tc1 transposase [Trichonephila clavipes]